MNMSIQLHSYNVAVDTNDRTNLADQYGANQAILATRILCCTVAMLSKLSEAARQQAVGHGGNE